MSQNLCKNAADGENTHSRDPQQAFSRPTPVVGNSTRNHPKRPPRLAPFPVPLKSNRSVKKADFVLSVENRGRISEKEARGS